MCCANNYGIIFCYDHKNSISVWPNRISKLEGWFLQFSLVAHTNSMHVIIYRVNMERKNRIHGYPYHLRDNGETEHCVSVYHQFNSAETQRTHLSSTLFGVMKRIGVYGELYKHITG